MVGAVSLGEVGGNVTTIHRLMRGLRHRGHEVRYAAVEEAAALGGAADVVMAFHAVAGGLHGLRLAERFGAPLIVVLTGTDVSRDDPGSVEVLRQVIPRAAAVVAFTDSMLADLASRGVVARRVRVIPQSVDLPMDSLEGGRQDLGVAEEALLFLLVAGLRPIKRPHFPLRPLRQLLPRFPHLRLRVLGEEIDADYAQRFHQEVDSAWAAHVSPLPYQRMAAAYHAADVVLNCSLAEGMSGAVLEAMACGRALLVSDIAANRALIRHGENGLRFGNETDFTESAAALASDAWLRARFGAAAQADYQQRFSVDRELDAYQALYREVLSCREA